MATLKQRMHRKNASGTYDLVHLETESSLVLRPSGRTVEQDLADYLPTVQDNDNVPESLNRLVIGNTKGFIRGSALATEGHKHAAGDVTSGSLGVARGGTGRSTLTSGAFLRGNGTGAVTMSSVADVKTALGIGGTSGTTYLSGDSGYPSSASAPAKPTIPAVGGYVNWVGYSWLCAEKRDGIAYLVTRYTLENIQWSYYQGGEWLGSYAHMKCMNLGYTKGINVCDYVLNIYGSKVFLPPADAVYENSPYCWSHFKTQSNRIAYKQSATSTTDIWWTMSPYGDGYNVGYVNTDGSVFSRYNYNYTHGFRPAVAIII